MFYFEIIGTLCFWVVVVYRITTRIVIANVRLAAFGLIFLGKKLAFATRVCDN